MTSARSRLGRHLADAWAAWRLPIGARPARPSGPPPLPDWQAASPAQIRKAYGAVATRSAGGWYALDDRRAVGPTPRPYTIHATNPAGTTPTTITLVLWRDADGLHGAPEACPHMGASLAGARVADGCLVCPWHGLHLGPRGHGRWKHVPVYDDGVLVWARLDDGDAPTDAPVLADRPTGPLGAVIRLEGRCEPEHVIRNRLDPWHGGHFHPYSFCDLSVVSSSDDALVMHVAYRVLGPVVVDVVARFTCPDRRTIVMTIIDGEGRGSVVETHATPTGPGRTAVIEATLASSERAGFRVAERLAPWLRPLVARSAARLWQDDLAYAERLYVLERSQPGDT